MKILASLTTMVVVFLFMTYLGVLSGLEAKNIFLQNKEQSLSAPIAEITPSIISPEPSAIFSQVTPATQKNSVPTNPPTKNLISNTPAINNSIKPTITTVAIKSTIAPVATSITHASTAAPTRIPTTAPAAPPVDNHCIVTISGSRYDVTQFRNIHSGGDVFKCGTDMTAVFLSQHSASFLQKMSQYKV